MDRILIVSACLVGINCKYNGGNNRCEILVEAFKKGKIIPLCPEQLGGLSTPRPPAKISGKDGKDVLNGMGKVLTVEGEQKDVTENFLKGAYETLYVAELLRDRVVACILKERSPSCGVKKIYKFETNELKEGMGVTAALLNKKGFKISSSDSLKSIEKFLREIV
jgi:uncharacterized protein YbbK (DUF523 family)